MVYRRELLVALLVFAPGCAGKTQGAPAGGDGGSSSSSGGSGPGIASSGASSGGDGVDATVGGSGGGSASGSSSGSGGGSGADSGGDGGSGSAEGGGTGGPLDAEIPDALVVEVPDAFPASCLAPFHLYPDAAPNTCAVTPSDVACDANTDCLVFPQVGCGCIQGVWGLNKTATVRCVPPPCLPPPDGCEADASGYLSEDCQLVPNWQKIAAACVSHQCLSFATGSN